MKVIFNSYKNYYLKFLMFNQFKNNYFCIYENKTLINI